VSPRSAIRAIIETVSRTGSPHHSRVDLRTSTSNVRKSTLEWWGDPVRLTVSIMARMAERGDTLESIERWEDQAAGGGESLGGE